MFLPSIIENDGRGSLKQYDIPSKLFEQNIITLFGEINEQTAYSVITQLLYLDSKESCEEINLYISSGGGSVYAGNAIIDTIHLIKKPVNTICTGTAMSMGNQILASGTGERRSLPNSRIMIHSVSSGSRGTYHDLKIDFEETQFLQKKLMNDLANYSKGKTSFEQFWDLTQRDKFLTPDEALELGLIDRVL